VLKKHALALLWEKMEKPNVLLVPKWKDRTHKTHLKHIAAQGESGRRNYRLAFLGDSMMERWLTTGVALWTTHFAKDCINLGVGGDGIENLLYRLKGTQPQLPGCLDNIVVDCVLLMIGTNNLSNRSAAHISAGIANVVAVVRAKQPKARIVLYGLTYRKDVDKSKVTEVNSRLRDEFSDIFTFFGDELNLEQEYDDHVHLNALGYSKWLQFEATR